MLTVYDCIVNAHDLRLVALAAVICALASFTAVNLLHHVRSSEGRMRQVWLGVAATATGFGIWATHFIAMLAFSPGIPSAYNIALTFLSLIAAIFLTGAGLCIALTSIRGSEWLGGAIRTAELTEPGFRHDVFSAWHPLWVGGPVHPQLADDLARHGLEYVNTDVPTATAFPDGSAGFLLRSAEANADELGPE